MATDPPQQPVELKEPSGGGGVYAWGMQEGFLEEVELSLQLREERAEQFRQKG